MFFAEECGCLRFDINLELAKPSFSSNEYTILSISILLRIYLLRKIYELQFMCHILEENMGFS